MMPPGHGFPQESSHLCWVPSYFVYVGYCSWVVHSNQHCLILVLVLKAFRARDTAFNSRTFMYGLFSLSEHAPFVEACSKWAPQPSFETYVKIWIMWSLGEGLCPSSCLQGSATTLGELKWSLIKEWGCPMTEDISSAPQDETERPHVNVSFRDHLAVEVNNQLATSNILQSKHVLTLSVRWSPEVWVISFNCFLQGLNLAHKQKHLSGFEFGLLLIDYRS